MNKRRGGIILIIFGLIAAIGVGYLVLRVTQQAAGQKIETVPVLVALQDVPERTVLSTSLVAVRRVLPDGLPPGVLTRPEQVSGQMTTTRLFAGEMILNSRLADTSGNSGLSYSLEKGRVLVTWPGSDIMGLNAVRPGDHVDLLMTIMPTKNTDSTSTQATPSGQPGAEAQPTPKPRLVDDEILPMTTQFSMQNLVVVGVGPYTVTGQDGKAAAASNTPATGLVTFAVNHQDAIQLKFLKDHERLKTELVLRAAGDESVVTTEPVTLQNILDRYHLVKANP